MKYRIVIEGTNFLIETDEGLAKHGFYATRFVEADDHDKAEVSVVELIRSDEEIKAIIRNRADDPPKLFLDKVDELSSFDGISCPGNGYTFFLED